MRGAQASTKEAADEADSDDDELQDDFEANRPRLSLPIDEDQDDSLQLPPQISAVLEEDLTQKSVEMPRRAFADQSLLRDATRASDVFPLTPDQKSGITREALLRRASSPGMSIVVGDESILQSHRQGYDVFTSLLNTGFDQVIVTTRKIYAISYSLEKVRPQMRNLRLRLQQTNNLTLRILLFALTSPWMYQR